MIVKKRCLIELSLGGKRFGEELFGPEFRKRRRLHLLFGSKQVCLGARDREPIVGGVDAGENVTRLNPVADIDEPFGYLAADAETEVHFRARSNRAGIVKLPRLAGRGNFHDLDRAYGLLRLDFLLRAAGENGAEQDRGEETGDERSVEGTS